MALKHHVTFVARGRMIPEACVFDHFYRLGYALVAGKPGEWRFHRGTKLAALWRFDIRAYATDLVVRLQARPDGNSWVSCDFEVWTFMTLITSSDIATLEAEARELESILHHHAEPASAPGREGSTSFRSEIPFPPRDAENREGDIQGIRAEPSATAAEVAQGGRREWASDATGGEHVMAQETFLRAEQPLEMPEANRAIEPALSPRKYAAMVLGIGVLILAVNGVTLLAGMYYPVVLAIAPGLLLLGLVGLIDPRIALATSKFAKEVQLPLWTYIVGFTLLLGGFAAGGYLAFFVLK
jgi:hypothetical protein